jgi:hypothetical protein
MQMSNDGWKGTSYRIIILLLEELIIHLNICGYQTYLQQFRDYINPKDSSANESVL